MNKFIVALILFAAIVGTRANPFRGRNRYGIKNCDCVCGIQSVRKSKIVGGEEVSPNRFPWTVALSRYGKIYCGASVISNNFLLTASHCVSSFEPNEIRVYVGGHNISNDYTEIKRIKRIISHEKFDIFNFNNDIALLELETPVLFGPKIQPVCLPNAEDTDLTDRKTLVAGWGRLSEKAKTASTLQAVVIPIWSDDECKRSDYGPSKITENMMCGGYYKGERDACQGDSGGAMIAEGKTGSLEAVGVVSWGRGCARKGLPGIYTKVVNYLDWISEKMGDECLCKPRMGQRTNFIEDISEGRENIL